MMSNPMNNKENKDQELKESLIKYLQENPDERLWQAIRNWSEHGFIYVTDVVNTNNLNAAEELGLEDTFYFEGKK